MPALAAILDPRSIQSPVKLNLTTLLAAFFSFLVSALWRPRVHKKSPALTSDTIQTELLVHHDLMHTPVNWASLTCLRTKFEQETALTSPKKAFTDRAILLDENKLLFEQNNEKVTRSTARSVVGTAKVMTYDDILEAQRKRDVKEAARTGAKLARRKGPTITIDGSGVSRTDELQRGMRGIKALGLEKYCSML
ncbi:MAG: hypothetical protein Q9164_001416 [Protoblastenia rupestris]